MTNPVSAADRLKFQPWWLSIGWALVAFVVYESLTPHPIPVPGEEGDKVGHILAYSTLMFWFSQVYLRSKQRRWLAIAILGLGILMECAQYFTPTRSFDFADMAADAVGVAIGWLAAPPRIFNFLRWFEKLFA